MLDLLQEVSLLGNTILSRTQKLVTQPYTLFRMILRLLDRTTSLLW